MMRVRVCAVWSGPTSHWLVEPVGRRLKSYVDGLLLDVDYVLLVRRGDVVHVEPIDASEDSRDEGRIAAGYLVVGLPVEDDFG